MKISEVCQRSFFKTKYKLSISIYGEEEESLRQEVKELLQKINEWQELRGKFGDEIFISYVGGKEFSTILKEKLSKVDKSSLKTFIMKCNYGSEKETVEI